MANIWVIRPDGTDLRQVTPLLLPAYEPSWSPDGSAIVFSGSFDGQLRVVRLDDPATLHLLSVRPGLIYESPEWGPER